MLKNISLILYEVTAVHFKPVAYFDGCDTSARSAVFNCSDGR